MKKAQNTWGKLPKDVINELDQRYWQHLDRFKQLLQHGIADPATRSATFPIKISLKPPISGKIVAQNTEQFQHFIKAWHQFANQHPKNLVQWQNKTLGFVGEQTIPVQLVIPDLPTLSNLLGIAANERLNKLQQKFSQLITLGSTPTAQQHLFVCLVNHLERVENLSESQLIQLVKLIPQLHAGMGQGNYLRAINVAGIDTKFIENHLKIIEHLVSCLQQTSENNENVTAFDLLSWLGCDSKPKDWLTVRPLCEATQQALANFPILKLSSQTLINIALPADNILIIENETPCFMLPSLANTIAVAGGGKNLTWLQADWLKDKKVGYWGDIDSEGLAILSYARKYCPQIQALMMDKNTLDSHQDKRVAEPVFNQVMPSYLTDDETVLFTFIQEQEIDKRRLEQEFIHQDMVKQTLEKWLAS